MAGNFLKIIARIRWIQRWNLKRNTIPENVMEHSWEAGVIAHMLGVINQRVFQGDLDAYRLATLALYHDCAESITGDLPTPVKYYSPELKRAYEVIERDAENALLAMLPVAMQSGMAEVVKQDGVSLVERKYIKAADMLSAILKAKAELSNGNNEYQQTLTNLESRLEGFELPEVDYFLEHFVNIEDADDEMNRDPQNTMAKALSKSVHKLFG